MGLAEVPSGPQDVASNKHLCLKSTHMAYPRNVTLKHFEAT